MKILRFSMALLVALQLVGMAMLWQTYTALHGGPAWDASPAAEQATFVWYGALLIGLAIGTVYGVLALLRKVPRDKWMALLILVTIMPFVCAYFGLRFGSGV
jgi:hypothetical protein